MKTHHTLIIAVIVLSTQLFIGCHPRDVPLQTLPEEKITTIPFSIENIRFDKQLGIHLSKKNEKYFLTFFQNHSIHSFSLEDSAEMHIHDLSNYLNNAQTLDIQFKDSSLYLWNHDARILFSMIVSSESIKLRALYNLSNLLDWKKFYIKYQPLNTFRVFDRSLYISYGLMNPASFFLDTSLYAQAALMDSNKIGTPGFLIRTPVSYLDGSQYLYNSYLFRHTDTSISVFFQSSDSAYSISSITGKIISKTSWSNSGQFSRFNRNKETDLAYVRKYINTSEKNEKVLQLNNSYIVLKRLKSESTHGTKTYLLFNVDSTLQLKAKYKFPEWADPDFMFSDENSLILIDKKERKIHTYDL